MQDEPTNTKDELAGDPRVDPKSTHMSKEMLINVSEGEECRIALLENGKLEEFYIERTSATSHVGNIYKGRVVNVEPSIQAAFVDFGLGRNGFLHISDLQPSYFGHRGEDVTESVGRKLARRDRPPIQRCLRRGDEIVVQIIKEGIGTKGPTLTTYLSIPGRIIVMMPGMSKMGISRKIEDEAERKRLRQILDQLEPPEDCGFIIRTAGVGRSKAEIQRDLAYLTRLWQQINKKIQSGPAPMTLYTEGDLVTRTVRDIFSNEIDRIIVDNQRVAEQVRDFIKLSSPRARDKVELYAEKVPLFHKYNIERDIEMMYSRHVPLPSGGSLVIDQTEAVVAIDVNSGKFRDHADAETTAFKTDMEAAEEIARQLRLRDLGGVIICDFIDLRYDRHRRELEQKLHECFKKDRAKTKVLRMSQFGIIELTRQRMRPSVKRSIYCDCPHCRGSGLVKTPESMSLDVMRKLAIATNDERVARVELTVHNDVANYLNNRKRRQLADLEESTGKKIIVKTGSVLGLDEVRYELFDSRDGLVLMDDLLMLPPQSQQEAQVQARQSRQVSRPEQTRPSHPGREVREELEDIANEAEDRGNESLGEERREREPQRAGNGERREQRPVAQQPADRAAPSPQDDEQDQRGGRRRRGRRGRGRGRGEQGPGEPGHLQPEVVERVPSTAWIQMPGEEDTQPETPEEAAANEAQAQAEPQPQPDVKPAPIAPWPEEPRRTEEIRIAPIAEAVEPVRPRRPFRRTESAPVQRELPKPVKREAPAEPEPVNMAPIADWDSMPVVRRRTKAAASAKEVAPVAEQPKEQPAEAAEAKPKKRTTRKTSATKSSTTRKTTKSTKSTTAKKTTTRRSKKAKVDEPDVSVGAEVEQPTDEISPVVEEPKVRIADEPTLTRDGDRHLASDEPADPEAVHVVKTYRDLDNVLDSDE